MAEDTPQTELEANTETLPDTATPPTQTPQTEPAPTAAEIDALAPRAGESVEQYAARVRGEVSWRDKQIGRQHRQKKEADERLAKMAELEAEREQLKGLLENRRPQEATPTPQPQPKPTPVAGQDLKAQAKFEYGVERLGEELNSRPEWRQAARNIEAAGGVPPELVADILDTDHPANVMLELGNNPEKFQQILDMSPGRRRAAVYKLGMQIQAAPEPTAAPKPSAAPTPLRGLQPGSTTVPTPGGLTPDADDRAPIPPRGEYPKDKYAGEEYDSAWYAARREQKRNSIGRPWSFGGRGGPQAPRG